MNHIFIDTETTGLGPQAGRRDQIIEIAFVWNQNGKINTIQEFANPGPCYLIDCDEALNIQGRTILDVLKFQDISRAARKVKQSLDEIPGSKIFHSWNIPFDKFFVEQDPWNLNLEWGDDPMILASRYMGYSYDRIALWKAVNFFEIEMPEKFHFHSALADAYMAMKVYEAIGKKEVEK